MHDQRPILNQVNLLAQNWDATLAFYRLLGFEISSGEDFPPGSGARHVGIRLHIRDVALEFDNEPMARQYNQDAGRTRGPIIGFAYPSADAVDAACDRVRAAGHVVHQPPYNAFWGARYAIVEDPDGTTVGLMGPIDPSRKWTP